MDLRTRDILNEFRAVVYEVPSSLCSKLKGGEGVGKDNFCGSEEERVPARCSEDMQNIIIVYAKEEHAAFGNAPKSAQKGDTAHSPYLCTSFMRVFMICSLVYTFLSISAKFL